MSLSNIYTNVLLISRNSRIFSEFLEETLNNKIFCFLVHISICFNDNLENKSKNHQVLFDYIFNRIETDLRELGHGDMSVNKKMKVIVTKFYSILIDFKNFCNQDDHRKREVLNKYFIGIKNIDNFSNYLSLFFKTDHKDIDLTSLNDITPA
ncbi:MAG: ubiquinol-cytochrome C chaperone family protein [Pelagibacteraceae bacterium]|jgi:cytochrome b pre-mRNA-processing protein 3